MSKRGVFRWRIKGKVAEIVDPNDGSLLAILLYHLERHYDRGHLKFLKIKPKPYGFQINPITPHNQCVGQFILFPKFVKELNQALWRERESVKNREEGQKRCAELPYPKGT